MDLEQVYRLCRSRCREFPSQIEPPKSSSICFGLHKSIALNSMLSVKWNDI